MKFFKLNSIDANDISKERLYLQKWDGWSALDIEKESEKQNLVMLIHCCTKDKGTSSEAHDNSSNQESSLC